MAWLYLPGSVGLSLDSTSPSPAIDLCVTSSGTPMLRPPLWPGWKTRPWRKLLSGTMLAPSTASRGMAGGFPCQDISTAGKGAGIEGARSGLWSEYARIIREVGPRYVFVENVPALTTRGLNRVLGDLASLGFDAEWDCFSAAGVGAPHKRLRIFILAQRVSDTIGDTLREEPRRWSGSSDRPGAPQPSDVGIASVGDAPHGRFAWPPGPGDTEGWRTYLEAGGPSAAVPHPARMQREEVKRDEQNGIDEGGRANGERRAAQRARADRLANDVESSFRGSPNGFPSGLEFRVDRLRCLGNAVVPQVAARAFITLSRRLVDA